MKASELRIGNYLQWNNFTEARINNIKDFSIVYDSLENSDGSIKPIPLTEEWLIKFGFEIGYNQKKMLDVYCKDFGLLIEKSNGGNFYYKNVFIQYVHQLQNLYFALTKEELTIKQTDVQ